MSFGLIVLLVIMIIFIIFFMYIEPIIMKHKVKNDNEYGSARFSTKKEIKNNFKKENINNIKEAGFPVSFSYNLKYIYFDRETPHYVYLGSTGSGKSVTAVIPECSFIANAEKKRSVFITDPKGEIFNTTSKMFENHGYEVLTIDFRHPELSNRINILEPIINEYEEYIKNLNKVHEFEIKINKLEKNNNKLYEEIEELKQKKSIEKRKKQIKNNNKTIKSLEEELLTYNTTAIKHLAETNRLISSLSKMVTQEKFEQKDPFWNNTAKNLLEGLIGFFLEEYKEGNIKREQITMTSIRKFQNSSMESENIKKFKNYINKKEYGNKSKDALISILSAADNTYKSITAVFGEKMNIFDDINVANVTSSSDFRFDCLGTKPTALYVIVPDEDKTYYTLVTIIVGMIYKELTKLANKREDKMLEYEIDFILDEFANCPPLADIESMVSVARSRGMHFHFFIQSFSQLNNVYGKEVAQIILDNCGLIYLKTNTQETAEAISKRLGRKTIESNSIRQSVSLMNYNGDRSTNLIGRELMTPEEVIGLHYKTIIFPIIGHPIFRKTIIYKKFSCYESGFKVRNKYNLVDLSNTYFTVEDIKLKEKIESSNEIVNDLKKQDKLKLEKLEFILKKIFINNYKISYEPNNEFGLHMKLKLNRKLTYRDRNLIESRINKEKYHYEIKEEEQITTINIYNKNPNISLGIKG